MSGNFEEELENIKASLKHLGAIEESLVSEGYLESRSASEIESLQGTERFTNLEPRWGERSEEGSEVGVVPEKSLLQCNEIIKEKTGLINRLYNCIEELKGEIQELTSSLDYHIQMNSELEKELDYYRFSKEPEENYVRFIKDLRFLQSEYQILQEKYDDAMNQLRARDLKNAELSEMIFAMKGSEGSSLFQSSMNIPPLETRVYNENISTEDICSELARELLLDDLGDIVPRVVHLKEYYSHSREFRKLYKKIAEIMIKRVGKANIVGLPSCMGLWKWISAELEAVQDAVSAAGVQNTQALVEKLKTR